MELRKNHKWLFGKTCLVFLMVVACGGLLSSTGCTPSDSSEVSSAEGDDQAERFQEEYFRYAIENLQRIQESGGGEMRQQIVDRLNQWVATQQLPTDWEADPMVEQLPMKVDPKQLAEKHFSIADGYALQQAIWMRELSKWTCGESNDPVQRAEELFDWIVRNIMLKKAPADGLGKMPKQPWETLFFGRGTAVDRAWVFAQAARQQAIDAVVLMVPSKEDPEKLIPWAIGVMKDKELYLFDPELGLPIPAKDGVSMEGMRLAVETATLSQIIEDPAILGQLDVSDEQRYPISIEQIQKTVAMIPASESSLSARFALVESRMAGDKRAILTIHPSALAKELGQVKGLGPDRVRLWPRPFVVAEIRAKMSSQEEKIFELAMQPFLIGRGTPLWKGRAAHIMGKLVGEGGATHYYQKARPSDRKLMEYEERFSGGGSELSDGDRQMILAFYRAKQDASYWLGLVGYALGDPKAATDYFMNRTLKVSAIGPWHSGAVYNLSRCLENVGDFQRAASVLRADKNAPGAYGNQLRAEWLAPQRQPAQDEPPQGESAAEKPVVEKPAEQQDATPTAETKPEEKKSEAMAEASEG